MPYEVVFNYRQNTADFRFIPGNEGVKLISDGYAIAHPGSNVEFLTEQGLFAALIFYENSVGIRTVDPEERFEISSTQIMGYIGNTLMLDDGTNHVEVIKIW